jgi:hypothetical protein
VTPQQLEKAQVISHPTVNPTARAALPGRAVATPQVHAASLVSAGRATSAMSGAYRPAVGESRQPAPLVTRNSPPTGNAGRALPSASNAKTQPPPTGAASGSARPSPPSLITRSTPPPPRVPFVEQQRSMHEHPGRPLEPQQLDNLRARRPAGPMLDREFPPHVAPIPRAKSAPPPQRGRQ